jgi:hypothetical protein
VRLYSSTLALLDARVEGPRAVLRFAGCGLGELVVEHGAAKLEAVTVSGRRMELAGRPIAETALLVYAVESAEDFELVL